MKRGPEVRASRLAAVEPGAHIASGIRYVNPQRAAELERAERVIAELRA